MPRSLTLDGLPTEIIGAVVWHLELQEIRKLRLMSRNVATACQRYFEPYCHNITINLTSRMQLENFVCMTQHDQLGCVLRHLTLAIVIPRQCTMFSIEQRRRGHFQRFASALKRLRRPTSFSVVSPDCTVWDPNRHRHLIIQHLTKALKNYRANSSSGRLQSLKLAIRHPGNELIYHRPIEWAAATQWVFQIATTTFAATGLPTERLDVFGSSIQCCGLPCQHIQTLFDSSDTLALTKGLKHLSLGLSTSEDRPTGREEALRFERQLCQVLKSFEGLEDLGLHWDGRRAPIEHRLLSLAAIPSPLPRLKSLSLTCFRVTEAGFGHFFSDMALLTDLTLESVVMGVGKFGPVIEQLAPQLDYLRLKHLWEDGFVRFVHHFIGPSSGNGSSITRKGAEIRVPIEYWIWDGMACHIT